MHLIGTPPARISPAFEARLRQGAGCFNPAKDIVVPPHFIERETVQYLDPESDYLSAARPTFAHFRGSVLREPYYSRGIRQWMRDSLVDDPDLDISFRLHDGPDEYWNELANSTFCLCPPGWVGWSPRFYQAIAAG